MENKIEQLSEDEQVIDKIHHTTGWDENIIGCWYHNYQSPQCSMLHGSCKGLYLCQLLESNYVTKGEKE